MKKNSGTCKGYGRGLLVAACEVGKRYRVINGGWEFKVTSINDTHTFIEHAHGSIAWPNDLPADMIILEPLDK